MKLLGGQVRKTGGGRGGRGGGQEQEIRQFGATRDSQTWLGGEALSTLSLGCVLSTVLLIPDKKARSAGKELC